MVVDLNGWDGRRRLKDVEVGKWKRGVEIEVVVEVEVEVEGRKVGAAVRERWRVEREVRVRRRRREYNAIGSEWREGFRVLERVVEKEMG
jgi:hypothetical protein